MTQGTRSPEEVRIARTDEEILACLPVMSQLRPHLTDAAAFLAQVRRQAAQQFELAYVEENGRVVAVAGFRLAECLFSGRFLYVDDLITEATRRSAGHGQRLFDWLVQHAAANRCTSLRLDSGVQRFAAHRFYLRNRMSIVCHHFDLPIATQ